MLELKRIEKTYGEGESAVLALRGVELNFRASEFVSILGPSGCGKTTLLNIVGGLDRYTSGDLVINGKSTKDFTASDWDAYRNRRVGFVFQSYNLIPHLSVLGNVELALTLAGISSSERKRRASDALSSVGLTDQLNKKPNQLSGGQMQRVAIARALVNDPEILLADEPTGALDSSTSLQIMELLKKIACDRLVVMVTHNGDLAQEYSTRIIRLLDGEVVGDSSPYGAEEIPDAELRASESAKSKGFAVQNSRKKAVREKTSMSFFTALSLSFRNLVTKKGRTFLTSFAGSIGIIGVALVLALSSGFSAYIAQMQSDTLSGYPLVISREAGTMDIQNMLTNPPNYEKYPDGDIIYSYDSDFLSNIGKHTNNITAEYTGYVKGIDPKLVTSVAYIKSVRMYVMKQTGDNKYEYIYSGTSANSYGSVYSTWQQLFDPELIADQYEVKDGRLPENKNEIVLVLDKYNRLPKNFLEDLGIESKEGDKMKFEDFVGMEFRLVGNDSYFVNLSGKYFVNPDKSELYNRTGDEDIQTLTVSGIIRQKEDVENGILSSGFGYTNELMDYVYERAHNSAVTQAQVAAGEDNILIDVYDIPGADYPRLLRHLGAIDLPAVISIYPKNFNAKSEIKTYLDEYNVGKTYEDKIQYSDLAEMMTSSMGTMINIISYVLIAFAAISLIVSSIMIGIITYVSVIERTKEIGVLRSLGARKKDISRVFNAETVIIGFVAGIFGVILSFLLTIPINLILFNLSQISGLAALNPLHAILLVVISMGLTLISGLIPARIAAKKDPVVALRTE